MSLNQYNALEKARLIDLLAMPMDQVMPWLSCKPQWMQQQIGKAMRRNRTHNH